MISIQSHPFSWLNRLFRHHYNDSVLQQSIVGYTNHPSKDKWHRVSHLKWRVNSEHYWFSLSASSVNEERITLNSYECVEETKVHFCNSDLIFWILPLIPGWGLKGVFIRNNDLIKSIYQNHSALNKLLGDDPG